MDNWPEVKSSHPSNKEYMDTDNPFRCRKCGSDEFVCELEGNAVANGYIKAPAHKDLDSHYEANDDMEIDMDNIDVDFNDGEPWECAKCGSQDFITADEAMDILEWEETNLEELEAAGMIIHVHRNQIDLFTRKPVGQPMERLRVVI